jgi:DNA-binding beta-propeller fold protein YncE
VDVVGFDSIFVVDMRLDSVKCILAVGRNPDAMVWSVQSDLVYCVNSTTDDISVVDGDGTRVIATLDASDCPSVLALSPPHRRVYVGHLNSTQVYVIRDTLGGVSEFVSPRLSWRQALRAEPSVFRVSTVVTYVGASPTRADLNVFAESGELVRSLRPCVAAGGCVSYRWDGRDSECRDAPEGVYFLAAVGKAGSGIKVVKVR